MGYSALAQRNEPLAIELLEEHRRFLRSLFGQFSGLEVDCVGDGFFVEFGSALEATRCAVEIQRALEQRNRTQATERRIRLRVGLHLGDVIHREGKVSGNALR
ncbi:MAG: adenylate/guanylate cyclase domain-containing protein [Verrucomicrobia bacterium]|nr:adenylate/guanylate cyclase domain-containing protein [Verrucomicrobiota bacterium]